MPLTWREYEYLRLISTGHDKVLAFKRAFNMTKQQANEGIPALDARADMCAMMDFITGELGKFDDDLTRLVRLRQSAYEIASDPTAKSSDRAAMMTQYAKLTTEINKRQAREEQASEDVDSLLKEMKKARGVEKEVIEHEEENEGDAEGQGEGREVLGSSAADAALELV